MLKDTSPLKWLIVKFLLVFVSLSSQNFSKICCGSSSNGMIPCQIKTLLDVVVTDFNDTWHADFRHRRNPENWICTVLALILREIQPKKVWIGGHYTFYCIFKGDAISQPHRNGSYFAWKSFLSSIICILAYNTHNEMVVAELSENVI